MQSFLNGFIVGLGAVLLSFAIWRLARRGRKPAASSAAPRIEHFVTHMQSIGELSVYRVMTKEIISASEHWFGDFGRKYLNWLLSEQRITLIMEFDVDFRFDLTDPAFRCERIGPGSCRVTLPPCRHEVMVRDMRIHSEDKTELMPWLVPDLVGRFFTGGFSVDAKNQLIAESRQESRRYAAELVGRVQKEAQASSIRSLGSMTRGFGMENVEFLFLESPEFNAVVHSTMLEKSMDRIGD